MATVGEVRLLSDLDKGNRRRGVQGIIECMIYQVCIICFWLTNHDIIIIIFWLRFKEKVVSQTQSPFAY